MDPITIEEVKLSYKIARLGWDIYKAVRNSVQASRKRAGFKIVSSLTTIEFVWEGEEQIAHYVQDRTIAFVRDKMRLPPFSYATAGKDEVEKLIVEGASKPYKEIPRPGGGKLIEPDTDIFYSKGQFVRAILVARSINGFTNDNEYFTANVSEWVDELTFVIIFPPEKKPKNVEIVYQSPGDLQTEWSPVRNEKYEVRQTTRDRLAFVWEARNLRYGNNYQIRWDW